MNIDPSTLIRLFASRTRSDPRSVFVLVDDVPDRASALDKWITSSDPEGDLFTYADVAQQYIDSHIEEQVSGDYLRGAEEEVASFITFHSPGTYILTLVSLLLDSEEYLLSDVEDAYTDWSTGRPNMTAELNSHNVSIKEAAEENMSIVSRFFPSIQHLSSVRPVRMLHRSDIRLRSSVVVATLEGFPVTTAAFQAILQDTVLNNEVTYISRKTASESFFLLHKETTQSKKMPLPKENQLLITVNGRDATLNGEDGTLIAYSADIPVLLSTLNLVEVERTYLDSAVTVTYPLSPSLRLYTFYYFIQNTKPWSQLMGVDDSQYKLGQGEPRPLFLRYDHYSVKNADGIDTEEILKLSLSLSKTIDSIGGKRELVNGLSVTVEGVLESRVRSVLHMMSRLLSDYEQKATSLIPVYTKENIKLIPPIPPTSKPFDILSMLEPDVFNDDYITTCEGSTPTLLSEAEYNTSDKNSAKVGDTYISCGAKKVLEYRHSSSGDKVPCCIVSSSKRTLITQSTDLDVGQMSTLIGLGGLFGTTMKEKKGSTAAMRVGINQKKGGLIECLYKALDRRTVDNVLKKVRSNGDLTPFRQCMWEHTEEEMREYLQRSHLDSDLVADGLAAHLGINIFITEQQGQRVKLRAPLFKFAYYLPYYTNRECVILYRRPVRGSGEAYELVVRSGRTVYLYDDAVSAATIDVFKSQYKTELIDRTGSFSSLPDVGPYIEPPRFRQILDEYGKCRGHVEYGGLNIYYEHPRAPLLNPVEDEEVISQSDALVRLLDETPERLEVIREKNVAMGSSLQYLPVSAVLSDSDPSGKNRIEMVWDDNRASLYSQLDKTRSLILQLTLWMFSNHPHLDYFQGHVVVEPDVEYHFETLPLELGKYTISESLVYLQGTGLTRSNEDEEVIIVPSEAVRLGVLEMMRIEAKTREHHVPARELVLVTDTTQKVYMASTGRISHTVLLNGTSEYKRWMESEHFVVNALDITESSLLDLKLYEQPFPLISASTTDAGVGTGIVTRWLVQNVANGSYQRAMNCCIQWLAHKSNLSIHNTGYYTEAVGNVADALNHTVIYTRDETGLLSPNVEVDPAKSYITLLAYPGYKRVAGEFTGFFAALLPLTTT